MKKILLLSLALLPFTVFAGIRYNVYYDTVQDMSTSLVWTKCPLLANGKTDTLNCTSIPAKYTWNDAVDICNNLNSINFRKRSNWHLPNIKELSSLITISYGIYPQINKSAFPGTLLDHYWTSTTLKKTTDVEADVKAWYVDFWFGNINFDYKDRLKYVYCVSR